MFTSDRTSNKGKYGSTISGYLLAAVSCAVFGAIYECFSHGVYSCFMIGASAFPLLFGALAFRLLQKYGKPFPGKLAENFICAGVAALTVGSIVQGVLEIYGTANPLVTGYWIAGGLLTAIGWLAAWHEKNTATYGKRRKHIG